MFTCTRTLNLVARRGMSAAAGGSGSASASKQPPAAAPVASTTINVTGLSSRCVKPATGPVGPGAAANAEYKV